MLGLVHNARPSIYREQEVILINKVVDLPIFIYGHFEFNEFDHKNVFMNKIYQ